MTDFLREQQNPAARHVLACLDWSFLCEQLGGAPPARAVLAADGPTVAKIACTAVTWLSRKPKGTG